MKIAKNDLEYYDEESKTVLKGFSQTDLDQLNRLVKILVTVILVLGTVAIIVGGYILYWLMDNHYATRLLEALLA